MNERKPFNEIYKTDNSFKKEKDKENNSLKQERKRTSNGITLIALVISIIVMLILAGVSLNAVIGDNGIITQAQNATYMQSVAVLEEYLQQEYVKKYDQLSPYDNKLDGFIYDSELRKIIQKASNNSYYFLDSENYK